MADVIMWVVTSTMAGRPSPKWHGAQLEFGAFSSNKVLVDKIGRYVKVVGVV